MGGSECSFKIPGDRCFVTCQCVMWHMWRGYGTTTTVGLSGNTSTDVATQHQCCLMREKGRPGGGGSVSQRPWRQATDAIPCAASRALLAHTVPTMAVRRVRSVHTGRHWTLLRACRTPADDDARPRSGMRRASTCALGRCGSSTSPLNSVHIDGPPAGYRLGRSGQAGHGRAGQGRNAQEGSSGLMSSERSFTSCGRC